MAQSADDIRERVPLIERELTILRWPHIDDAVNDAGLALADDGTVGA